VFPGIERQPREKLEPSAERLLGLLHRWRADPNLDNVQTEVLSRRQLGRDPKVALTTDRPVAEYWACLAAASDQRNNPEVESSAVVLVLNAERLIEREYELKDVYEENWYDWQNEIACWNDIIMFDSNLIGVEPVTSQRTAEIGARGRAAVSPAPPIAGIELRVMLDTIDKLRKGEITLARADAVASALAALRSTMS